MQPYVFPKPRTIEQLVEKVASRENARRVDTRKMISMIVIDDQPFAPQSNLSNHGFSLQQIPDISSIKQVETYPIVLCDLQGVGLSLSQTLQGAHVIKEIRKSYPEKIVIAYTGGSPIAGVTRSATAEAHYFLPKDERIEKWVDVLDEAIAKVSDPIRVWKTARAALLESGATILQILLLEDAYVKAQNSDYERGKKDLKLITEGIKLIPSAKGVMENLIASVALKLTFGI